MSSCSKGGEPVPQFDEGVSVESTTYSSSREGVIGGGDGGAGIQDGLGDDDNGNLGDAGGDGDIIGGDDNEDDDDVDVDSNIGVIVGSGSGSDTQVVLGGGS